MIFFSRWFVLPMPPGPPGNCLFIKRQMNHHCSLIIPLSKAGYFWGVTSPNVGGHFFTTPKKVTKSLPGHILRPGFPEIHFGVLQKNSEEFFVGRNGISGADPEQVNSSGQRALDIARRNNRGASHQEVNPFGFSWGWVAGKTPHVRYQSSYPHVRYPHETQSLNKGLLTRVVPFIKKGLFHWWGWVDGRGGGYIFRMVHQGWWE